MAQLLIKATDQNLDAVNDFIHAQLTGTACSESLLLKLDLAVEEIFVNIAHYAYAPHVGDAEILCTVKEDASAEKKQVLTIVFKDNGAPFNPLAREDPDPSASLEERRIGGWGIFLTKKYMDSVSYAYADGKNILTLKKTLGEQPENG